MAVSTDQPTNDEGFEAPVEPPRGRSGEEVELELVAYAGGGACPEYGDGQVRYGAQALVSSSPDGEGSGDGIDLATTPLDDFEAAPRTGWVPVASDWMAGIPDHVSVRDMSVPGTHESAAYQENVGSAGYALCQSRDLDWQLNNGVRYLDVRLRRMDSKVFSVHHGDYYLKQMFGDVLQTCRSFLSNHRSETILMRISQTKSSASAADFTQTFNHYLDTYWGGSGMRSDFFISSTFPTLGQARGKIVLMSGWPYLGYGLHFSNENVFDLQDMAGSPTPPAKKDAVRNHLSRAVNTTSKQKMFVNHTSAYGTPVIGLTPWGYAQQLNPYTLGLLNGVAAGKTTGVIAMDYVDRPAGSTSGGKNDLPLAVLKLNQFAPTPTGPRAISSGTTQGAAVTGPAYQGVQNQSFHFRPAGLGPGGFTYRIENVYSGLALSMNANGSVTVQPAGTSNDQHFSVVNQADGSVGIRGAHNGLVLDMSSAGTVTGRAYAGNTNQSLNLFSQGDGSTGIRSKYYWLGA
ncbi:phosphatidylinositol-specific phospholipase C domain-containing protein [Streptomyces sp. NPDC060010]|uniref:phosphatidylinositol-specific phospholipase C domain-containing protein n=1 Tax=Streptomyces sp. NPDC060010 TaxID=3347036 RepID=UPI00368A00C6